MAPKISVRYDFLDLLKGLGIFLVVWGHTMFPRSVYIYSFHMPLFFFLSGYVHKDKPGKEFFLGRLNRLFIPYAVFSFLSWLFYLGIILCFGKTGQLRTHLPKIISVFTGTAINGGNDSIWYLPCLLVVSILFWLLRRFLSHPKLLPVAVFLLSIIGYTLGPRPVSLPFKVDVALTGLAFYYLGHLTRETAFLQEIRKLKTPLLVALILVGAPLQAILARLNVAVSPEISKVALISNRLGNYFLFYAAALLAIMLLIAGADRIGYNKVWNYLGVNSLVILASHKPLFDLFQIVLRTRISSHWLFGIGATLAAIFISLPLIKLTDRYFPFLIGKKTLF